MTDFGSGFYKSDVVASLPTESQSSDSPDITFNVLFLTFYFTLPQPSYFSHPSLLVKATKKYGTMSFMNRALNIYTLPQELLSNLSVRTIAELDDPQSQSEAGPSTSGSKSISKLLASGSISQAPVGSLSCQSCPNTLFESVEEQRAHFKSDWHRYNSKARMEGKPIVDAEQWENMVEGESIPLFL